MNRIIRAFAVGVVLLLAAMGCIRNDIPYPVIKLDILTFEADGLLSPAAIDNTAHTVKLALEETTDIRKVNVTSVTMTEGAPDSSRHRLASSATWPGRR